MNNLNNQEHVFNLMTVSQRGHFRNPRIHTLLSSFRYFPVKKIIINNDKIALERKGQLYTYTWLEIKDPIIISQEIMKAYSGRSFGKMVKKSFCFSTPDKKNYEIDVSHQFPDFENNEQMLNLLDNNLNIKTFPVKKYHDILSPITILILFIIAVIVNWHK